MILFSKAYEEPIKFDINELDNNEEVALTEGRGCETGAIYTVYRNQLGALLFRQWNPKSWRAKEFLKSL